MSDAQIHPTAIVDAQAEIGPGTIIGPYCIVQARRGPRAGLLAAASRHALRPDDRRRAEQILCVLLDRPANAGSEISGRADLSGDRRRKYLPRIRHGQSQHDERRARRASAIAEIFSLTAISATIARSATRSFFRTTARSPATSRSATTPIMGGLTAVHQFCRLGPVCDHGRLLENRAGRSALHDRRWQSGQGARASISSAWSAAVFRRKAIKVIKEAFRLIYRSKYNTRQAIEAIQQELPASEEINQIVEFIRAERARHHPLDSRHGDGVAACGGRRSSVLDLLRATRAGAAHRARRAARLRIEIDRRVSPCYLLRHCFRFMEHDAQDVVPFRIDCASQVETSGGAEIILRRHLHQPDVFEHRRVARPGGKLFRGGAILRRRHRAIFRREIVIRPPIRRRPFRRRPCRLDCNHAAYGR